MLKYCTFSKEQVSFEVFTTFCHLKLYDFFKNHYSVDDDPGKEREPVIVVEGMDLSVGQ